MRKRFLTTRVATTLLLSVCCMASFLFGAVNTVRNEPKTASAATSVNVTDYVSVSSQVVVTPGKKVGVDNVNDSYFPYGMSVSSDKPYSGSIVPTFSGDSSIVFKFTHPTSTNFTNGTRAGGDGNGDFKFIVTDLYDATNYIVIHYLQGQTVRVEYPTDDGMKYLTAVAHNPGFNNVSFLFNTLDLAWKGDNNDELVITITRNNWAVAATLAHFNGTEEMPKITFPNGYRISFSSDYAEGTDIAFKSILGYSLIGTETGHNKCTDMTMSGSTVEIPAEVTEVITYNGMEVADGATINIPQFKQLGTFSTAWKYKNMMFPKTALTATGTIDTTVIGNTAQISVDNGGTVSKYNFKVVAPVAPSLTLVGEKPTDGFAKKAITVPTPSSDIGVNVEVGVTVNEEIVEINNYVFTPEKAGTYVVTYTAKAYGFTVTETLEIKVVKDEEKPVITVNYDDNHVSLGTEVTLPSATATDNADEQVNVLISVTLNGQAVTVTNNKFIASQVGEYIVTYYCEDITGNRAEVGYVVTCINLADFINVPTTNLITAENAKVTAQAKSNKHVGLGVSSETAYTGTINAIFDGDNALVFKFPGNNTANSGRGDGKGDFFFKVADANNPEDYFTVQYGGSSTLGVYLTYKGEKRYCTSNGVPQKGSLENNNEWATGTRIVGFKSDRSDHYNKLAFTWEDGVLSVIYNQERWLPAVEYAFAKFDGTEEVTATTWGLPKLDWEAYTISFGSNYTEGDDHGTDIIFLGVDGETDFFAQENATGPISKTFIYDGKIVTAGDTLFALKSEGVGEFYSRFGSNGVMFRAKKLTPDGTMPTDYGTYPISFTIAGTVYRFTLRIADEFNFPVIKLKNDVSSMTIIEKNASLSISANDVVATDDSCGVMQDAQIKVYVKKATDTEFVAYNANYKFAEVGEYIVKYTATDAAENASSVERTIKVVTSIAPMITLSQELPQTEYLGQTITLPTATAEGATVSVIVSYDGELLEIENNQLLLNKLGEYTVVYTAVDAQGVMGVKEYTLTAIEDKEIPVITVDFASKNVVKGSVVSLPNATAEDNVDGAVSVSVKVSFGTEEIAVANQQFTAEKLGAYTVTYSCVDKAGNLAEKSFIINVQDKVIEPEGGNDGNGGAQGDQNGCNSAMFSSVGVVALGVALFTVLKRRKEEK